MHRCGGSHLKQISQAPHGEHRVGASGLLRLIFPSWLDLIGEMAWRLSPQSGSVVLLSCTAMLKLRNLYAWFYISVLNRSLVAIWDSLARMSIELHQ